MPTFLDPLVGMSPVPLVLRNRRNGQLLASTLEPAFDPKRRNKGLLGRDHIEAGSALIIAPCSSIHMFFMKFPIDVIFAAKDGRVLKIRQVRPWRIAMKPGAFTAIELPAGAAALADTRPGDRLEIVSSDAPGPEG
jgi:uncharacterized membrane protein (UPF0127 family)